MRKCFQFSRNIPNGSPRGNYIPIWSLERSWSFDKGFWKKENKAMLEEHVDKVVMPKKGK